MKNTFLLMILIALAACSSNGGNGDRNAASPGSPTQQSTPSSTTEKLRTDQIVQIEFRFGHPVVDHETESQLIWEADPRIISGVLRFQVVEPSCNEQAIYRKRGYMGSDQYAQMLRLLSDATVLHFPPTADANGRTNVPVNANGISLSTLQITYADQSTVTVDLIDQKFAASLQSATLSNAADLENFFEQVSDRLGAQDWHNWRDYQNEQNRRGRNCNPGRGQNNSRRDDG